MQNKIIVGIFSLIFMNSVHAQILVDEGSESAPRPRVGKGAAADYFKAREEHREAANGRSERRSTERQPDSSASAGRYLTIHMGSFISDKAYRWGANSHDTNVGSGLFGVTYRVGEWKSSMDLLVRAELMSYSVDGQHPVKLAFMPIVAFPDSRSDFPLYFGAGAGGGIFFKQLADSSDLSIDYSVLIGARFLHVLGDAGLFVETGIKGQFFLLSEGQQQGVYLLAGGAFVF